MARKVMPERIDDENPEWSADDFRRARPAAEVLPAELVAVLPKKRGPKCDVPKEQVTLRLDHEVLEWFRKQGKGYQTRIGNLLRAYMEAHRKAS
jgi:uncharacterized protein (DUF4415 family)